MEFRRGILFIRLKGDLNKNTIKGVIDEDFKYVVLNLDNMYSIDSYSIKYINKIRKNGCYKFGERKAYPYAYCTEKSTENESSWNYDYYISKKRNPQ